MKNSKKGMNWIMSICYDYFPFENKVMEKLKLYSALEFLNILDKLYN